MRNFPLCFAPRFGRFLIKIQFSAPLLSTLLAAFFLLLPHPVRADKEVFKIGLLPEMNVFQQMERYQPLASYLGRKLGMPVEIVMLSRYGNILESIEQHHVDGAFFGSFTGALAITQLNVEPIARPLFLDGTSTYYGKLFVRRDSGIQTVADMKGKTLALVEKATTAGYIFPLAYFHSNGITDLENYFGEIFFAGSHDATIQAVLDGKADIGAAKNTIFEHMAKKHPEINEQLVVLKNSPKVPSNGLCVRPEVDETVRAKLKDILLQLHKTSEGEGVLEKLGALLFVETTRADYQVVVDLAQEAGINIEEYQYKN